MASRSDRWAFIVTLAVLQHRISSANSYHWTATASPLAEQR